jgi:hypothetical protein
MPFSIYFQAPMLMPCSSSQRREILIKFSTKFSCVCVRLFAPCEKSFLSLHAIYIFSFEDKAKGMETNKRSLIDDGFIGFSR